jgi:hypothetical protein
MIKYNWESLTKTLLLLLPTRDLKRVTKILRLSVWSGQCELGPIIEVCKYSRRGVELAFPFMTMRQNRRGLTECHKEKSKKWTIDSHPI